MEHDRRAVLTALGTALTTGLAGCGSGGGDGGGGGGYGGGGGATATETTTATDTATETTTTDTATATTGATPTSGGVPSSIDSFLSDANGYDGTIVDATGQQSVSVAVGGGLAFDPAAVRIDVTATVNWEWEGGTHNVVSTPESDSDFDSGDPTGDTGTTFSQSFDNAGVQLYVCEVHEGSGMLGAVDVV